MQLLRIKNLETFTISGISEVWFTRRTTIREPHLSQMFKNQRKHHKTLHSYNTVGFEVSFLLLCWSLLHRSVIIPQVVRSHLHFAAIFKVNLDHGPLPWWFLLWLTRYTAQFNQRFVTITIFPFQHSYSFQKLKCFGVLLFCLVVFGFVACWRFFCSWWFFFFGLGFFWGEVLLENKTSTLSLISPCI